ncbi:hypothetical protein NO932_02330 [Pelagibacterium sp. 26DY04]|nr:hypothetical protein [Pelagibacterium sp. 26DY04]WMT87463.1 hypothetical protein NO932_02330 [Pelagibacterium sp. 26DY04]
MAIHLLDVRLRAVNPVYSILPYGFFWRLRTIVRIAVLKPSA